MKRLYQSIRFTQSITSDCHTGKNGKQVAMMKSKERKTDRKSRNQDFMRTCRIHYYYPHGQLITGRSLCSEPLQTTLSKCYQHRTPIQHRELNSPVPKAIHHWSSVPHSSDQVVYAWYGLPSTDHLKIRVINNPQPVAQLLPPVRETKYAR